MEEKDMRICPVCGKEVERNDMNFTRDCHGITFRLVCYDCWEKLMEKGYDISKVHMDCGIEMFDAGTQDTHAGGSGCGCAATVLTGYIFKQLKKKAFKKILFIPTGALMSPVSFNEGNSVPGIAHCVMIEV